MSIELVKRRSVLLFHAHNYVADATKEFRAPAAVPIYIYPTSMILDGYIVHLGVTF